MADKYPNSLNKGIRLAEWLEEAHELLMDAVWAHDDEKADEILIAIEGMLGQELETKHSGAWYTSPTKVKAIDEEIAGIWDGLYLECISEFDLPT